MNVPTMAKRILLLAANPTDTGRLRLAEEVRSVQGCLERSPKRDQFVAIPQGATRTDDLRRALLKHKPAIVHFSGHGAGEGLVLEDDQGHAKLVSTKALAGTFELCPWVECVLLNACYSQVQALAIARHVPYVIGMTQVLGDQAAIQFAKGFYDALGNGEAIPVAYKWGINNIELENIPEASTPVLLTRSQVMQMQPSDQGTGPSQSTVYTTRVFISYRDQSPDRELARTFFDRLQEDGHHTFMAAESIPLGESWEPYIHEELNQCDYFLLLLSPQSVTSEMVTEEVRRVKQLRDSRSTGNPVILPVRVQFPFESPLNYELRGYLESIQQRLWQSEADTPQILQEVRQLIREGRRDIAIHPEDQPSPAPAMDSIDLPPLPVAEPELQREPGGSIPLKSGLYIERPPIEADCFAEILQPGALIRIRAPRQMGKTSLMARILNHAREQGYEAIPISFQRADSPLFGHLDQLLHWFCAQIGRRRKRLKELEEFWDSYGDYGNKDKCNDYFEDCLLQNLASPLVLGLDEVDLVFPYQHIADDFFGLLRSWYEAARYGDLSSDLWEKLRVVVVHSTEPYVPLNINQSPFNVGKRVELPEFTPEQVQDLAQRYGLSGAYHQAEVLMNLVGGHPYLIRKALYHLRRQDVSLAALQQSAHTEAGIYGDHLRRHLLNLQGVPNLPESLRQVVTRDCPVDIDANAAYKLESMGLVEMEGNCARPRCAIYRQYFRDHLCA